MRKLFIPPDDDSYSLDPHRGNAGTRHDGGIGRIRRDLVNPAHRINVRWTVNPSQFIYLWDFYRTLLQNGSIPFQVDLITEHPFPQTHLCQFVPESWAVPNSVGHTYVINAILDVRPLPVDEALANKRIAAFELDQNADLVDIALILQTVIDPANIFERVKVGTAIVPIESSTYFLNPDSLETTYTADQLPSGLSLSSVSGQISGTPTAPPNPSEPPIAVDTVITATTSVGVATKTINFEVVPSDYIGIGEMVVGTTFVAG